MQAHRVHGGQSAFLSTTPHRIGDDLQRQAVQAGIVDFVDERHVAETVSQHNLLRRPRLCRAPLLRCQYMQPHRPPVQLACSRLPPGQRKAELV